jgi:hypothetical protein
VGLFKSISRAVRKVVKPVAKIAKLPLVAIGATHGATALPMRFAPKVFGVKSAAAKKTMRVSQTALAAAGVVGGGIAAGGAMSSKFAAQLAAFRKTAGTTLTQALVAPPAGGTTYAPTSTTTAGGISSSQSVGNAGGRQGRRTYRPKNRRARSGCVSYRGRRYCPR